VEVRFAEVSTVKLWLLERECFFRLVALLSRIIVGLPLLKARRWFGSKGIETILITKRLLYLRFRPRILQRWCAKAPLFRRLYRFARLIPTLRPLVGIDRAALFKSRRHRSIETCSGVLETCPARPNLYICRLIIGQ